MDSFTSNDHNKPTNTTTKHQPSSSELLSSAKLVAEAATATLNHDTDKIERAKVAAAAEDLLAAASHHGKLEDKNIGKYVKTAENYLHQYNSSHPTATSTATSAHPSAAAAAPTQPASAPADSSGGGDDGQFGSGGYGEYIKMAEGLLKKH